MIAKLSYALVLFVHPSPEPRIYAVFPTAEACRSERAAVVHDLQHAQITAACIPQNQVSMDDAFTAMRSMIDALQNMPLDHPGHKKEPKQ